MTQPGAGGVLALAGPEPGDLEPPELEMLFRNLMGALLRLARERDMGAQVGGIVTQVEEQEDCGEPDMWEGELGLGIEGLGPAELQEPDLACGDWGTRDGLFSGF